MGCQNSKRALYPYHIPLLNNFVQHDEKCVYFIKPVKFKSCKFFKMSGVNKSFIPVNGIKFVKYIKKTDSVIFHTTTVIEFKKGDEIFKRP